jgi:regulatory protein YycH of two-component signal transduction system YycFG
MQFILKQEEETKRLTFGDVKIDQFFVNSHGCFCQKYCIDSYNKITNSDGSLFSRRVDCVSPNDFIERILPEVKRIQF